MKRLALGWAIAASALMLAAAACTVEESDDTGKAGSGQGGEAGQGQAGAAGNNEAGAAGQGQAGEAGAAGAAGQSGDLCDVSDPQLDECNKCLRTNCCDPWKACYNDPADDEENEGSCLAMLECVQDMNQCSDPDPSVCAQQCSEGAINVPFNDMYDCLLNQANETNCLVECGWASGK